VWILTSCGQEAPAAYEGDEVGECSDGADNDQDTLFDCDDPGCAGAPICTGSGPTGDGDTSTTDTPGTAPDDTPDATPEADIGPDAESDVWTSPIAFPVDPANPCPPLAPPEGPTVELSPSQAADLGVLMAGAAWGTTFLLADGVYNLDGAYVWISSPGVTLRSKSGDRDAVVLDGGFETETAITVAATHVTLAEFTLRNVLGDAIRVQPDPGGDDVVDVQLHGLVITDALGRAVAADGYNTAYADAGVLACSQLYLTDEGRARLTADCDAGGVDLRQAANWTVRDNRFHGFWCEDGLAEAVILAWRSSADTLVERNRIEDCTRGIGLGKAQTGIAGEREHPAFECDTDDHVDHYGGVVRNNMLFIGGEAFLEAGADFESGIHVWSGCRARVVHNTVVGLKAPFSSIEWRWGGTVATEVLNNLVSHNLRERTEASAIELGNLEQATEELFVDRDAGDLHLAPDVLGAINSGEDVPDGLADHDFEGELRLGVRDIGADERLD